MKLDYHNTKEQGKFIITNFQEALSLQLLKEKGHYKIIWCTQGEEKIVVDGYDVQIKKNQVLFCTPVNTVDIPKNNFGLIAFVFNREFYCIQHNDSEVSCMGILFYGSSTTPIIHLSENDQHNFNAMLEIFQKEFETKDHIQGEMLRTLLKRLLITSTRIIKQQSDQANLSVKQAELIRKFMILVEQHFKEKHQVADYAQLLFKSPKTLSNFFKKHKMKSPLKIINDRIATEAKRLLKHSDKSAEEIAYELGYKEPSHFSKFFKTQVGITPLSYRKQA